MEPNPENVPASIPAPRPALVIVPACQVCGRQDETLRLVSYPWVLSLVVITFRRAFTGLWCSRHRGLRWGLAAVITSIAGWIGLPFGLIYTPLALIQLAQGGKQPAPENARLLRSLAADKLQKGDLSGARRCLEASLQFEDDPAARESLHRLYGADLSARSAETEPTFLSHAWPPAAFLAGSALTGLVIGLLDYCLARLLSPLTQGSLSVYLAILTWTPLVVLSMCGLILLRQGAEWAVDRAGILTQPVALALSTLAALLAIYGLPDGMMLGRFLYILRHTGSTGSATTALFTAGAALTRGGVLELKNSLQANGTSGVIYLVILTALLVYYLYAFNQAAARAAYWKQRLLSIKSQLGRPETPTPSYTMIVLAAALVVILVLGLAFPQHATLDYVEAVIPANSGHQALNSGLLEQAGTLLQDALVLNPNLATAHNDLGWVYFLSGEMDAALSEFKEAVRLQPGDAMPHTGLGRVYTLQGNLQSASDEFNQAIHLDPKQSAAVVGLGIVYIDMGAYDQAEASFNQAVQLNPQSASAQVGLGEVYNYRSEYAKAEQAYQQALKLDSSLTDAHLGLGRAYFYQNKLDEAVSELETVIQLDPKNSTAQFTLSLVYNARSDFDKSAALLETLLQSLPLQGIHALLSGIYYQLDRVADSDREMSAALNPVPTDAFSWYALSSVHNSHHDFAAAQADLQNAIQLSPQTGYYHTALADAYTAQGMFDQALAECDQAQQIDPKSDDALLTRGSTYIDMQKLDLALVEVNKALAINPQDPSLHSMLSFLYYQQGKIDKSLQEAAESIRLVPYNGSAYTNLAFAYRAQNKPAEALQAAQQAVKLSPKRDVAHFILGMLYLDSGQKDQAAAELRLFLDLYWDRAYIRTFKAQAETALAGLKP